MFLPLHLHLQSTSFQYQSILRAQIVPGWIAKDIAHDIPTGYKLEEEYTELPWGVSMIPMLAGDHLAETTKRSKEPTPKRHEAILKM